MTIRIAPQTLVTAGIGNPQLPLFAQQHLSLGRIIADAFSPASLSAPPLLTVGQPDAPFAIAGIGRFAARSPLPSARDRSPRMACSDGDGNFEDDGDPTSRHNRATIPIIRSGPGAGVPDMSGISPDMLRDLAGLGLNPMDEDTLDMGLAVKVLAGEFGAGSTMPDRQQLHCLLKIASEMGGAKLSEWLSDPSSRDAVATLLLIIQKEGVFKSLPGTQLASAVEAPSSLPLPTRLQVIIDYAGSLKEHQRPVPANPRAKLIGMMHARERSLDIRSHMSRAEFYNRTSFRGLNIDTSADSQSLMLTADIVGPQLLAAYLPELANPSLRKDTAIIIKHALLDFSTAVEFQHLDADVLASLLEDGRKLPLARRLAILSHLALAGETGITRRTTDQGVIKFIRGMQLGNKSAQALLGALMDLGIAGELLAPLAARASNWMNSVVQYRRDGLMPFYTAHLNRCVHGILIICSLQEGEAIAALHDLDRLDEKKGKMADPDVYRRLLEFTGREGEIRRID